MGRYVVTGAAGFIGSALTRKLLNLGNEVHALDLPQKITENREKIDGAIIHAGSVAEQDIFLELTGSFEGAFHLAAQTSARISEESPDLDIDTNVKGTLNFCNWSRLTKPSMCIFTSSMAVYGRTGDNISEDVPCNPVSVYGVTKCAGEHFFQILGTEGIQTTVYRLFNVYGPGQDFYNLKQGMLSIFLAQAMTLPQIEVTGSLDRYRDFVYIDDVVDALLLCLKKETPGVMNVGNGKPVLVRDLIDQIIEAVKPIKSNLSIKQVTSHRGDVWGNYADISRIVSCGWRPKTILAEGLKNTIRNAVEVLGCR